MMAKIMRSPRYNRLTGYSMTVLVSALLVGSVAQAQTLYLDSNGDGLNWYIELGNGNNALPDCVTEQTTSIDVYLVTDRNPDGSVVACASSTGPLNFSSYQVILRHDGQVVVNGWTDNVGFTTMTEAGRPAGGHA